MSEVVMYAEIWIEVKAPKEEINKHHELKLSDALYEITSELELWLEKKAEGTGLSFKVVD